MTDDSDIFVYGPCSVIRNMFNMGEDCIFFDEKSIR